MFDPLGEAKGLSRVTGRRSRDGAVCRCRAEEAGGSRRNLLKKTKSTEHLAPLTVQRVRQPAEGSGVS